MVILYVLLLFCLVCTIVYARRAFGVDYNTWVENVIYIYIALCLCTRCNKFYSSSGEAPLFKWSLHYMKITYFFLLLYFWVAWIKLTRGFFVLVCDLMMSFLLMFSHPFESWGAGDKGVHMIQSHECRIVKNGHLVKLRFDEVLSRCRIFLMEFRNT